MDQLHPRSGQLPEQMSFDQVCNAQAFLLKVLMPVVEDGMTCSTSAART